MPFLTKYQESKFECLIWKIDESAHFFSSKLNIHAVALKQIQLKYRHNDTKVQWLASRYCLELLFERPYQNFIKDNKGKPSLIDQSYELSISHCSRYTAVVKSSYNIGVDIQQSTNKLQRIAHKYISKEILNHLETSPHYLAYLHLYWGIKEALFKAYGKGKLNFIQHLHIKDFVYSAKGTTKAQIIKDDIRIDYDVFFEQQEDFYLCIVTKSNSKIS